MPDNLSRVRQPRSDRTGILTFLTQKVNTLNDPHPVKFPLCLFRGVQNPLSYCLDTHSPDRRETPCMLT